MDAVQKKDIRNVRNEKAIKEALRVLLSEKEYDEITVGDIAGQAHIVKSTFYAYFENKRECLKALVHDALKVCIETDDHHFTEELGEAGDAPDDVVLGRFFAAARQYAPVYHAAFSAFSYRELSDLAFSRLYREYYRKLPEHERMTEVPAIYQAYRKVHGQYILNFIQIALAEDGPQLSWEQFRWLFHIWVYNFAKVGGYCKDDQIK